MNRKAALTEDPASAIYCGTSFIWYHDAPTTPPTCPTPPILSATSVLIAMATFYVSVYWRSKEEKKKRGTHHNYHDGAMAE